MPEKKTIARARKAKRQGKAPSTQAGEFVREEIDHVREGKHGARNTKQAIAIGLSKARRSGVKVAAPKKGTSSEGTRKRAKRDGAKGRRAETARKSPTRARAATRALKREGRVAASPRALSRQTRASAQRRKKRSSTTPRRKQREAAQGE